MPSTAKHLVLVRHQKVFVYYIGEKNGTVTFSGIYIVLFPKSIANVPPVV